MIRHTTNIFAALLIVLLAVAAHAQTATSPHLIYWQGGTGTLTDANYSDGPNMNLSIQPTFLPTTADHVYIGNSGIVTFSGGNGVGFGRLRVGHNSTPPGGTGAATLTLTDASTLVALDDGAAAPDAAVWVGNGNNGVLNIENGAELRANRLVVVGAGSTATPTGTLNIKSGGILTVSDGNLNIADRSGSTGTGVKGIVNISDAASSITIAGAGADLLLANRARTAIYNQTEGVVNVNDTIDVAGQAGTSTGTTFSISGGKITSGTSNGATAGNFFVGRGGSTGATVNISGTAIVNVGFRYLMGGSDAAATPTAIATGVVTNHSGGVLNTDADVRVADAFISPTSDATYNLSGTGVINSTTGGLIGRQGIGKFIQTGGTANFNGTLSIGNRETVTTTTANGLYKISAGDLNITGTVPTPPATAQVALNIAPNGTGEFRVVGDDATIDLTGDFLISTTANGNGKLAYEFESGDSLSQINVSGVATFGAGSILALDSTLASPTQTSYDLLTATTITDSGIAFSGPAGWSYQIVSGGNGQILRAVQTGPAGVLGDYNNNGVVDAADYVLWRNGGPLQNEVHNPGTVSAEDYTEWRARFGNTSGSGAGVSAAQVPEPAAGVLMLVGLLAISSGRLARRGGAVGYTP